MILDAKFPEGEEPPPEYSESDARPATESSLTATSADNKHGIQGPPIQINSFPPIEPATRNPAHIEPYPYWKVNQDSSANKNGIQGPSVQFVPHQVDHATNNPNHILPYPLHSMPPTPPSSTSSSSSPSHPHWLSPSTSFSSPLSPTSSYAPSMPSSPQTTPIGKPQQGGALAWFGFPRRRPDTGLHADPPDGWSRHPPAHVVFSPFPPMTLLGRGPHLDDGFPPIPPPAHCHPHPFASHDVSRTDWIRFLNDVEKEATLSGGQKFTAAMVPMTIGIVGMPVSRAIERGMKNRKTPTVGELVDTWNHYFFRPRHLEVVLARGATRHSGGPHAPPLWVAEANRLREGRISRPGSLSVPGNEHPLRSGSVRESVSSASASGSERGWSDHEDEEHEGHHDRDGHSVAEGGKGKNEEAGKRSEKGKEKEHGKIKKTRHEGGKTWRLFVMPL